MYLLTGLPVLLGRNCLAALVLIAAPMMLLVLFSGEYMLAFSLALIAWVLIVSILYVYVVYPLNFGVLNRVDVVAIRRFTDLVYFDVTIDGGRRKYSVLGVSSEPTWQVGQSVLALMDERSGTGMALPPPWFLRFVCDDRRREFLLRNLS
jgi:hypothetical protein